MGNILLKLLLGIPSEIYKAWLEFREAYVIQAIASNYSSICSLSIKLLQFKSRDMGFST